MDSDSGDFMSYMRGPSSIPGLTGSDVIAGSAGQGAFGGHCLYEQRNKADRERLQNPTLQARVEFWLCPQAYSLKDIKMECKSENCL